MICVRRVATSILFPVTIELIFETNNYCKQNFQAAEMLTLFEQNYTAKLKININLSEITIWFKQDWILLPC
jgi:hypothetical protein